jgi:PAS domain S-box-containing protein
MERLLATRDHWILEAFLNRLETFPDAPVFALNDWCVRVPVPVVFDVDDRPQPRFKAPGDLGPPSGRQAFVRAWVVMSDKGTSREPVELLDGSRAVIGLFDLRHDFGVIMGLLITDHRDPAALHAGDRDDAPLLVDRYGTTRRDTMGVVLDADAATQRMLGWDLEKLRGLDTTELIHPDDRERALTHWLDMVSHRDALRRWRGRHLRADGTYRWFDFTDTNLIDDPDHGCVLSDLLDVTDEVEGAESRRVRERRFDRVTARAARGPRGPGRPRH